jgi:RNA polymerase sigma-70 factor (ECF subfamily)
MMMAGSAVSLADLAERHRPEILRYLARLLGDPEDAEDACQEVFLRAQRAVVRLRPGSNARAWLYRIATNSARTAARRRGRRRARAAEVDVERLSAPGAAASDGRVQTRDIARAVDALPARQRAAVVLRRFHGFTYAEIAASLGGTEVAARANVYQAIRKLRAALGDDT